MPEIKRQVVTIWVTEGDKELSLTIERADGWRVSETPNIVELIQRAADEAIEMVLDATVDIANEA